MPTTRQRDKFKQHFPLPLVVTPMRDANYWHLVKEFEYRATKDNCETMITVGVDFATDFASVPIPFRWWIPKWGKYGWAAVIHDWLYSNHMYCKEFADDIFYEAMRISGVSPLMSKMMYLAVSWFGLAAWLSAGAKLKLKKSKTLRNSTDSHPDWYMPPMLRFKGMYEVWQQRHAMWKSRNQ